MPRTPTPEQFAEINGILSRVIMDEGGSDTAWGTDDWRRAKELSRALGGYIPKAHCSSCRIKLYDSLRSFVGLKTARRPDEGLRTRRIAICHECPAYTKATDSCGRLILDAFNSKVVVIDGKDVLPCGCIVSLKASFPTEQCPASKWPSR